MTSAEYARMKDKGRIIESESQAQSRLCDYMRLAYPKLWYFIDEASLKADFRTAAVMKRQQKSYKRPDIQLLEARGRYFGFFIELKREDLLLYKPNGEFINQHIEEQDIVLQELRNRGYKAEFIKGFDAARSAVDAYMKLPKAKIAI
jgi:hypothetical protein